MPVSETDALRIRLEGRLEVIESATQSLEELEKLVRDRKWPYLSEARPHLLNWETLQSRLPDAVEAAERANGSEAIERLNKVKQSLEGLLQKHFTASSIGRARDFSERLALWHELLQATGRAKRDGPPIAEVAERERSLTWLAFAGIAVTMSVAGHHGAAIVMVLAAVAAFTLVQGPGYKVRYRLFPEFLEWENSQEPMLQLPLSSFDGINVSAGDTLRGLVDLELGQGRAFAVLSARINQLANEREVLRREERSLERFTGGPGRWLTASFEPGRDGQPETVEVISFAKAERGTPIEMKSRRGATPVPKVGLALLCDRGVLFIPESGEQAVRSVLFDTERVELMYEQQRGLRSFPSELILDHLEELRRIVGVQWCDGQDELKWTSGKNREEVDLAAGRLSVSVDEPSRSALRKLWPA